MIRDFGGDWGDDENRTAVGDRACERVGNVTSASTTLAAGTDSQAFCYDEQNRLVWASSQTATGPTGCAASNTAGTLTSQGAPYTASYSYDALNRLTSSPLGTYTYGDPAHLHAVTTVSNGSSSYTAAYNPVGDLTCRAPTSAATCAAPNGSKTGAGLGYNNEGQLNGWQNTLAGTPTTTAHAAYDGEGRRVSTNVQSNGMTTSTTDYLAGGLEEVTTSGSTTTLTKYESVPGVCNVVIVGSGPTEAVSYIMSDGLGSVSEALDGNGNVTAQQLYGPYGGVRYSLGSMPTSKGFTGQYGDPATTGLDYYHARYYDPLVGQFTSADTAGDGLNRYAYVADDPETNTDPAGRVCASQDDGMGARCGVSGGGGCKTNCGGGCKTNCGGGCGNSCDSGNGGGGGGGCHSDASCGCYVSCPGNGVPGDQEVTNAINDARAMEKKFNNLWDTLSKFAFIAGLISQFPGGFGLIGQFLTGVLGTMAVNALMLEGLFNWESTQGRDFWDNPLKVVAFFTVALRAVDALNTAFGALAVYAVKNGPEFVALGLGAMEGAIASDIIFIPGLASDEVHQLQLLGYNPWLALLDEVL